ncbi:hypothetical protein M378DRAFT_18528, partial [Amanita muscaria Koide BX008]
TSHSSQDTLEDVKEHKTPPPAARVFPLPLLLSNAPLKLLAEEDLVAKRLDPALTQMRDCVRTP